MFDTRSHTVCVLDTPRYDCSSKLGEPRAVYRILQLKRSSNTLASTPNLHIRQQAAVCRVTALLAKHRQSSLLSLGVV